VAALGKYGYEIETSTRYHDLQDLFNNKQTLIGGSMNDCIKTTALTSPSRSTCRT
jgi:hypothetical protein